jgi:hypothetical protein
MRRWGAALAVSCALACPAAVSIAQTTGGISGWISDSTGAPLPGVTAEITSPSLQGRRSATAGRDGTFRFVALPPGSYKLTASLPGFATVEKTVAVELDATASVRMILQLSLKENVIVTAAEAKASATPSIDTTSTTEGTTYRCGVIVHLPVDRNYAEVVKANPAVFTDNGATQGRSLALAIMGSTSAENGWVIDGINTVNVLKGIQGKNINSEFVQEVEVKSGGYQAEYGRSIGGVINVITKSGGNTLHGDGFFYYDSSALQARRTFVDGVDSPLSGMRVDTFQRTDYGLSLGGPVVKDTLWFFAAYNRVQIPAKISRFVASDLVPTTLEFPLNGTDNLYSGKLTWSPDSSTTIVGTVFGDPTTNSGAGAADPRQGSLVLYPVYSPDPGTWQATREIGGIDLGVRANRVLGPTTLVTVEAARHQDRYELVPTGPGRLPQIQDFTCQGGAPDAPCVQPPNPNFVEGGFGSLGVGGAQANESSSRRDLVRADANLYLGNHDVKLGGDYQYARTTTFGPPYSGGQLIKRFNDYGQTYYEHDFSAKSSSDLTPTDWNGVANAREVGVFVQDSWKVAPNLTVNAGLRWDMEDVAGNSGAVHLSNEWQPRLGVVWDPSGNGTAKVYAFAGRFNYSLPTELALRGLNSGGSAQTFNFDPSSVAQDPSLPGPYFSGGGGEPVDTGLRGISLDELSIGIEKLIGGSLTLGLKATYRRLNHAIEDRCDLDYTAPENNGNTCALTDGGSTGRYARGDFHYCQGLDYPLDNCNTLMPYPLYGAAPMPVARRIYRGVELMARHSLSDRLWVQASYVFSSLRGNYDGEVKQSNGQTSPGINEDFDYAAFFPNSYGKLALDRPHAFRLDGYYVTPFHLSVGFQAYARSGAPLDMIGYFNQRYGGAIYLEPRGSAGRLPAEWDASLTLEYPIRMGAATVTLQAYLYNLFNNQMRTQQDMRWTIYQPNGYPDTIYDPNQAPNNPNYGLVTARSDPRLFRAAVRVSF